MAEVKKDIGYDFFVKDTAEFEQFADFKPITNLTAEEAVKKFAELKEQGFGVGIGINIPNDIVFDNPNGNGITILVADENNLANFAIFGDNFIKNLDIETQREVLKTRIAAYEDLYEELIKKSIPNEYPQFLFDKKNSLELNNNKEENLNKVAVTSSEIEEERQIIQKRVQWLKNDLEHPDVNNPDTDQYVLETKEYIERLENMSDVDIKNLVIWKKENERKNAEIHKQVIEQMKNKRIKENTRQNGELFSYNQTHPVYTLTNKKTGRVTTVCPVGKVEQNVKSLGRLKNLTEANKVIERIKASGLDIYSTESRIVLFNEDKFYDFDRFADSGRFNFRTEKFEYNIDSRNLNDWDFKYYIDHGLKITNQMKEFEKIGIYDNTPFAGLTKEEVGEICFGLWEAEDKGLLDYDEEVFHSGRYPAYPGDDFVTDYLLDNQSKYNFTELKEHFLSKENDVQINPVSLKEILAVMEM